MAAYASLLSLRQILEQLLQHPPRQMPVLDKAQIDSLLENITFLQDFLEDFPPTRGDEIRALEEKIARSAYAAEDFIEKRVVDQILAISKAQRWGRIFSHFNLFKNKILRSSSLFSQDLQKVTEGFGSMRKDVMEIKETEGIKIMQRPKKDATAGSSVRVAPSSKNTLVGFDKVLIQMMETLTGDESNLQIHSIVGMGGIGKTTLARNVFDNPSIVRHFDLHAWVTISQQYNVHEILLGLLKDIGVLPKQEEEITKKNDEELGLLLHRGLFDRRYFIVMDDIWSIKVWGDIKRFLPDNNNCSRVLITTRLTNVADDFQSCTPHQLHFLDEDQSWVLFCDKVFGKESCPPELEEVGKKIVRNCRGLPLAILAIGGLAKSSPTVEYWKHVAKDTYEALNADGEGLCLEILYLSYKQLPVHLRPCFLYMGIFPEDHKIRISKLIKLWAAEGILKPMSDRSLKEIAEDNLKDLVDRNLIQVHDYGSRNKIKTCTIHDLSRDLCLREARKENFVCVTMMHSLKDRTAIICNKRRLIIGHISYWRKQSFETRSSACIELKSTPSKVHRLLRELNGGCICSHEEIVRFVNSSCIDFDFGSFPNKLNILESLSLLWNLQTVTFAGNFSGTPISLPAEIWEMPQLMHLKIERFGDFHLPDPPYTKSKNGGRDSFVLKNLQTLYTVWNLRCADEVVGRIPNLRKLGINYREFPCGFGWDQYEVYNLAHLHNLESLYLRSAENVPQNLCFPRSLKKLSLFNCGVAWKDLTAVGSLPHLEVLYLKRGAVKGREWNPVEGQFLQLMSLRIEFIDLENWTADSSHFPRLENLRLARLKNLKKIPHGIGEIATLRSILLFACSDSANSSAAEIRQEQEELGNFDLLISVG